MKPNTAQQVPSTQAPHRSNTHLPHLKVGRNWLPFSGMVRSTRELAHLTYQATQKIPVIVASCAPWHGKPKSKIVVC